MGQFDYMKATLPTSFGQSFGFYFKGQQHEYMADLHDEVYAWGKDRFGEPSFARDARWDLTDKGNVFFRDEADAFDFRLRWC